MDTDEAAVSCPVSGCDYSESPASVAAHVSGKKDSLHDWGSLGYSGANEFKREYQSEPVSEAVNIGWLTDSHLGKSTGGYGKRNWQLQPFDDLSGIIDTLSIFNLDAVVHTGDLFHNDKAGISDAQLEQVSTLFDQFRHNDVPVLYILGNHAREEGGTAWARLAESGNISHLSTTPYEIGNTALYGIDFHKESWWTQHEPKLQPTNAEYTILCLHQSLEPYRSSNSAEICLQKTLPKLSRLLDEPPDIVLLGHLHECIDEKLEVNGKSVTVRNCGATTRLGKKRDSFDPGFGILRMTSKQGNYARLTELT